MKPIEKTLRLDKLLANMGRGSRKEIKQLLKQGIVCVNSEIVKDGSIHVNPQIQVITVNGERVQYQKNVYLMLHKPQGVLSATEDNHCDTVIDLVEGFEHYQIFPVGRLDKDSEGLLLLTNDGELSHQLLSPRKHVPKTYYIEVEGKLGPSDVAQVQEGLDMGDFVTLPGRLHIIEAGEISKAEIIICEGKFHQVKRMMQAMGKHVTYLKRIRMGSLCLDPALLPGQYRELTEKELADLRARSSEV